METIFALASGKLRAGIAVIRVSGPAVLNIHEKLSKNKKPEPRKAVFDHFKNPDTGDVLDQGLSIYFKSPASFTGEDVMEYHLHGGLAVIQGFLDVLSKQKNCRMAAPGEFTRRAFENGKLDLTEAEAIADLVDAETEAQKMQALDQLDGSLANLYQGWGENLKKLLAHQEADIEFPEEDMPEGVSEELKSDVKNLLIEINKHLDDKRRGERLRQGLLIGIFGAPNAGKSSLLNILAKRDAVIVSEEAGTTRDIVEVHLDLGGYPVILADTAGLRETINKIEAEGIKRAEKLAHAADLKIILFDGTADKTDKKTEAIIDDNSIVVLTKSDLDQKLVYPTAISLSSTTEEGVENFLNVLTDKIKSLFSVRQGPSLTRERHRAALKETLACLERSLSADLPELAAEDLRMALRHLGSITGKVHVEELLDTIFKDFCIGK